MQAIFAFRAAGLLAGGQNPVRLRRLAPPLAAALGLTIAAISSTNSSLAPNPSALPSGDTGGTVTSHMGPHRASSARLPRWRPIEEGAPRSAAATAYSAADRQKVAFWMRPPLAWAGSNLDDSGAILACEEKVRSGLPFPSSLNRVLRSTGVHRGAGGNPVVTFDADAVNGLGFPLAVRVQCVFEDSRLALLDVSPR